MLKTKFKIDLLAKGTDTETLCKIIANHNGGVNPVSLDDIASWIWIGRSQWDTNREKDVFADRREEESNKLFVMESKKCIAIIEEITVEELKEELV